MRFVKGKSCISHTNVLIECVYRRTSRSKQKFQLLTDWIKDVEETTGEHREEKPTKCHRMLYCTYDMLNMFRALLYPSSGARDYMCIITAYGMQCLVAGCRGSGADSRLCVQEEGCCTSCNIPLPGRIACCLAPDLRQPATKKLHTIGGNNTHSLKLLMMGIAVPETCWAYYKCNKPFSGI